MKAEPTNLYADGVAPVHRTKPGEVFFVRMEACPEPGSDEFGTTGGAYVNCYLDVDDLRSAELRAIALIQESGWQPQRFDTWELTCAECADDASPEDGAPLHATLLRRRSSTEASACSIVGPSTRQMQTTQTPNHAMERTADRRTLHF